MIFKVEENREWVSPSKRIVSSRKNLHSERIQGENGDVWEPALLLRVSLEDQVASWNRVLPGLFASMLLVWKKTKPNQTRALCFRQYPTKVSFKSEKLQSIFRQLGKCCSKPLSKRGVKWWNKDVSQQIWPWVGRFWIHHCLDFKATNPPLPLQCTYKFKEPAWKVKMKNIPNQFTDTEGTFLISFSSQMFPAVAPWSEVILHKSNLYSSQIWDKSEPKEITFLKVSFMNGVDTSTPFPEHASHKSKCPESWMAHQEINF